MSKIFSYKKVVTEYTTLVIVEPDYELSKDALRITELCTINGLTYVSIPDGLVLPEQPKEIECKEVELTEELKAKIEKESPYIQLMEQRTVDAIREKYSIEDELKALRCKDKDADGAKQFADYDKHVEDCKKTISTPGKIAVGLAQAAVVEEKPKEVPFEELKEG